MVAGTWESHALPGIVEETVVVSVLNESIKCFNKSVKLELKNHKNILNSVVTIAPSLPYLYGLVKTHKQGNPMRPIISSVGSITYKLSKFLVKILSPLLGTISNSHLKNSCDLVDKLNNLTITSDHRMVSFDVTSLFTKVPINDLLEYLSQTLDNYEIILPTPVIIKLVKLCIKDCVFTFNGSYYRQIFGMAMGNPLSPLLSNIYMEFFESRLIPPIWMSQISWFRYVDDILVVFKKNLNIDNFLDVINNLVPSIKFTTEIEVNGKIPFLDTLVHRSSNEFKYSIYRKPTNNLTYVHYFSGHTLNVKRSVFQSMFLRALRVCSPEFFDEEIAIIKSIGEKLCYPDHFLERCHDFAKKTFYNQESKPKTCYKNILCLPYHENFSHLVAILKRIDITVVFKFAKTIRNVLIKNSPEDSNNIIYSIHCNSCRIPYIGQTTKGIDQRINQHKQNVRRGMLNSGIFMHLNNSNFQHSMNWHEPKVLLKCNDYYARNITESALIQITKNNNMNMSSGLFSLDPINLDLMEKDLSQAIRKLK